MVGIVVDQMRADYLYRYYDKYEEGGFKRLMNEGHNFRNNHFNYIPTYTAPGHASIYTGTTPQHHGIIANEWYDRTTDKGLYCVSDKTVQSVGGSGENGNMSPKNMISTTVTDELELSTVNRSKVIGIAIKDRGAILPAGHAADAAYWFDPDAGEFISSTFYMSELPEWVEQFNSRKLPKKYLDQTWSTLLPIEQYIESGPDDAPYERAIGGKEKPVFPYDLKKLSKEGKNLGLVRGTPFGNTLTMEMALAAIEGEDLGQDDVTDFLAVSFSSTDYVGHSFGPDSKELEDTYIRLDRDLNQMLVYLDEKVGSDEYTLFLTADHGVVDVPQLLMDQRLPGGYYDAGEKAAKALGALAEKVFGPGEWIRDVSNNQIFMNRSLLQEKGVMLAEAQKKLASEIGNFEVVFKAYTGTQMIQYEYTIGQAALLQKGYNPTRSGDVLIAKNPGYLAGGYGGKGTSHGSGYNYDTHVPLLFFGKNISPGFTVRRTVITDIAPTISTLLHISLPNASIGDPLTELFE